MTETTYQPDVWDLAELLPEASEEVVSQRFAQLEGAVAEFEGLRDELSADLARSRFLQILRQYEALAERMVVVSAYASLSFAADTQSPEALTLRNRVQQLLTALHNRVLFFDLWWKSLDEEAAEGLLPSQEESADFRHHLEDARRARPFTLEERAEQLINVKDANGISAVLTLHSMLTNRLEFQMTIDGEMGETGETNTVTRDELMSHVHSPDAERRADTYRELYRVYEGEAGILGQIYTNRVRDWHSENVELRGFASPIAVRNLSNDVPDEAVSVLLQVASENASLFQRYFKLKARWLGVDRLRRYDLYAPLAATQKEIPYANAVQLVLSTLEEFHSSVAENARRVFAQRHIDSEVRKGKQGGAFCSTVLPSQTPWVLMNYTGRVRDVATLAHELGHAIHSMAAEDHSVLTQHPSLPLAETASVFAERLLTDRLLSQEDDPAVRRELLASAVDDAYATVMRQAFFVRFELAAHEAVLAGKSTEDLNGIYMEGLQQQFGDAIELSEEFRHEWVSIPHIFSTPFYCYAYSFGQLLVLALYQRYKQEGEAFIPGYLRLLAHGGAARPQEILAEIDVDITDAAFWQSGFDVIAGMVDELGAM